MEVTIILKVISAGVQQVLNVIEKVRQAEAAERDALKEWKNAMDKVESEIGFFNKIASALSDSTFVQRQDARDAMVELGQVLREMKNLLEAQQAEPHLSTSKSITLQVLLQPFIPYLHTERRSIVSDLNDITRKFLDHLQEAKRAFKLVWYLYTLPRERLPSIAPEGDARASANGALDAIQLEFLDHPFAISQARRSRSHTPFLILNQDHEIAGRREETARNLGKDWIDDHLFSCTASSSQAFEVEITLFGLVWSGTIEHLRTNPTHDEDDPEHKEFQQTLDRLEMSIQDVIARSQQPRFALSFYGMVKAGKSLFLNAMIGKVVLPSDELPSTAWPCRLVHVKEQVQPELEVKTEHFNRAIQTFNKHRYASKMDNYKPPKNSLLGAMVDGHEYQMEGEQATELRKVHREWMTLHLATRANLREFEKEGFKLAGKASGVEGVKDLLGKINDIVRLCKRFGVSFGGTEEDWPRLRIEFSSLKDKKTNEIYEARCSIYYTRSLADFHDGPPVYRSPGERCIVVLCLLHAHPQSKQGIGEKFQNSSWENLVRLAASQSNALVPIVSFMELSRSDWTDLPELAAPGFSRKLSLVVCTHLDRISEDNLPQQLYTISSTFWPDSPNEIGRVLPCSSLMGLSANQLLEQSETTNPLFKDVWKPKSISYHCASKILGEGAPEQTYNDYYYKHDKWRVEIKKQLRKSGLLHVTQKLTREMVDNARENALISETEDALYLIRELRKRAARKLLEARRTRDEFEAAKREYEGTRDKLERILATWDQKEQEQIDLSRQRLQKAYDFLSRKSEGLIQSALQATSKYCEEAFQGPCETTIEQALESMDLDGHLDAELSNSDLKVGSVAQAESFLCWSQKILHTQLHKLKTEYVNAVRGQGEEAKSSRIDTLRVAVQNLDDLQTELRDDIIAELASQLISIHELAYRAIKKQIKISSTRYTAKTAFQFIEAKIARRWLDPTADDERTPGNNGLDQDSNRTSHGSLRDGDDEVEEAARRSIEQLGFMLRAPITAVTSIAWTFSAPLWVFMPQSHTYHFDMQVIQQQYKEKIVQPWLEKLNEEGKKSLLGIIRASSKAARDTLKGAVEREEIRYSRELKTKKTPPHETIVDNLVTAFVNLRAAEEALQELNKRIRKK